MLQENKLNQPNQDEEQSETRIPEGAALFINGFEPEDEDGTEFICYEFQVPKEIEAQVLKIFKIPKTPPFFMDLTQEHLKELHKIKELSDAPFFNPEYTFQIERNSITS